MREFLAYLHKLAVTATNPGPNKWHAHTELMTWFRSDPVAVIQALQTIPDVLELHGGTCKARMKTAYELIPMTKPEEHAA